MTAQPMVARAATLRGTTVRLEPLGVSHLPGLGDAIRDGALWTLPVTMVPHPDELPAFLSQAQAQLELAHEIPFATIDIASGTVIGSTRFRNIDMRHRRVEIGFTFLAQRWQQTRANTEAKFLMLRHAFDVWCVNRIELLTDVLNARSRAAIERIGGRFEGTLRRHMMMPGGRVRDSALYSIIVDDWPAVRNTLESRLKKA